MIYMIWSQCPIQIEKCGDYFQSENGLRLFDNNIRTFTRTTTTTNTSLVLRDMVVNYEEVNQSYLLPTFLISCL